MTTETKEEILPLVEEFEGKPKLWISISSADQYEKCPRSYKFAKIDKLPKKRSEHTDVGNFVHETLQLLHNALNVDSTIEPMGEIKKIAAELWPKYADFISPAGLIKSKTQLKAYYDYNQKHGWPKVLSTEEKFSIRLSKDVQFSGIVDRFDEIDDELNNPMVEITDYKTGKSSYLDSFQLAAYGLYLRKRNPELSKKYKGAYLVLGEGPKKVDYVFTDKDVDKAKKELLETANEIMSDQTWTPKPTRLCDYCDFKDACPEAYGKPNLTQIGRTSFKTKEEKAG